MEKILLDILKVFIGFIAGFVFMLFLTKYCPNSQKNALLVQMTDSTPKFFKTQNNNEILAHKDSISIYRKIYKQKTDSLLKVGILRNKMYCRRKFKK
jgi:uncharacterized protein YxeA